MRQHSKFLWNKKNKEGFLPDQFLLPPILNKVVQNYRNGSITIEKAPNDIKTGTAHPYFSGNDVEKLTVY